MPKQARPVSTADRDKSFGKRCSLNLSGLSLKALILKHFLSLMYLIILLSLPLPLVSIVIMIMFGNGDVIEMAKEANNINIFRI